MNNKKIKTVLKYLFLILLGCLFFVAGPNQKGFIKPFTSERLLENAYADSASSTSKDSKDTDKKGSDDKIYPLDMSKLEKVQEKATKDQDDITEIPKEVADLNGKKVNVTGYLLIPMEAYRDDGSIGDLTTIALGKYPYGCPCCNWANSPVPTIFNTVLVILKDGNKLKSPLTPTIDVTGTFIVEKKYDPDETGKKWLVGLFTIKDAAVKKIEK